MTTDTSGQSAPNSLPWPLAVQHAAEIVAASEWSGDLRVNMTKVIGAGRVLAKRLAELESELKDREQSWQDGHGVQEMRHKTEVARLTGLIREVIAGNWCVTDLQESIGDL